MVPPESARLNLGGKREQTFSISGADHRTVCRFVSADDQQFLQVAAALADLATDALSHQREKNAAAQSSPQALRDAMIPGASSSLGDAFMPVLI